MSKDLFGCDSDGNVCMVKDGTEVCFDLTVLSENDKQRANCVETTITASLKVVVKDWDWFLCDPIKATEIQSDQVKKIPVIGLMLYDNCITQLFKVATKHV